MQFSSLPALPTSYSEGSSGTNASARDATKEDVASGVGAGGAPESTKKKKREKGKRKERANDGNITSPNSSNPPTKKVKLVGSPNKNASTIEKKPSKKRKEIPASSSTDQQPEKKVSKKRKTTTDSKKPTEPGKDPPKRGRRPNKTVAEQLDQKLAETLLSAASDPHSGAVMVPLSSKTSGSASVLPSTTSASFASLGYIAPSRTALVAPDKDSFIVKDLPSMMVACGDMAPVDMQSAVLLNSMVLRLLTRWAMRYIIPEGKRIYLKKKWDYNSS